MYSTAAPRKIDRLDESACALADVAEIAAQQMAKPRAKPA
jgi:hypothetical protein